MRIITGSFGGRRLRAPEGRNTRPTSSRVRESLFQHLASVHLPGGFAGLRVLDLYAGSGILSLEALSRGAQSACLVEAAAPALRVLRENIAALGVQERTEVVRGRLPGALRTLPPGPWDLIFCDPPYHDPALAGLIAALHGESLVHAESVLVVEHHRGHALPVAPWRRLGLRSHGETQLLLLAPDPDHLEEAPGS